MSSIWAIRSVLRGRAWCDAFGRVWRGADWANRIICIPVLSV